MPTRASITLVTLLAALVLACPAMAGQRFVYRFEEGATWKMSDRSETTTEVMGTKMVQRAKRLTVYKIARDLGWTASVPFDRGIADTIEDTCEPWEKRNYYLKADRFRLEWEWAGQAAERMAATMEYFSTLWVMERLRRMPAVSIRQ